jgi:glycosyl hydrolase family 114
VLSSLLAGFSWARPAEQSQDALPPDFLNGIDIVDAAKLSQEDLEFLAKPDTRNRQYNPWVTTPGPWRYGPSPDIRAPPFDAPYFAMPQPGAPYAGTGPFSQYDNRYPPEGREQPRLPSVESYYRPQPSGGQGAAPSAPLQLVPQLSYSRQDDSAPPSSAAPDPPRVPQLQPYALQPPSSDPRFAGLDRPQPAGIDRPQPVPAPEIPQNPGPAPQAQAAQPAQPATPRPRIPGPDRPRPSEADPRLAGPDRPQQPSSPEPRFGGYDRPQPLSPNPRPQLPPSNPRGPDRSQPSSSDPRFAGLDGTVQSGSGSPQPYDPYGGYAGGYSVGSGYPNQPNSGYRPGYGAPYDPAYGPASPRDPSPYRNPYDSQAGGGYWGIAAPGEPGRPEGAASPFTGLLGGFFGGGRRSSASGGGVPTATGASTVAPGTPREGRAPGWASALAPLVELIPVAGPWLAGAMTFDPATLFSPFPTARETNMAPSAEVPAYAEATQTPEPSPTGEVSPTKEASPTKDASPTSAALQISDATRTTIITQTVQITPVPVSPAKSVSNESSPSSVSPPAASAMPANLVPVASVISIALPARPSPISLREATSETAPRPTNSSPASPAVSPSITTAPKGSGIDLSSFTTGLPLSKDLSSIFSAEVSRQSAAGTAMPTLKDASATSSYVSAVVSAALSRSQAAETAKNTDSLSATSASPSSASPVLPKFGAPSRSPGRFPASSASSLAGGSPRQTPRPAIATSQSSSATGVSFSSGQTTSSSSVAVGVSRTSVASTSVSSTTLASLTSTGTSSLSASAAGNSSSMSITATSTGTETPRPKSISYSRARTTSTAGGAGALFGGLGALLGGGGARSRSSSSRTTRATPFAGGPSISRPPTGPPTPEPDFTLPPPVEHAEQKVRSWDKHAKTHSFQIILSGTPDIRPGATTITPNVDVYDVDVFMTDKNTIAALKRMNKTVICYFSGGTYEPGRPDSSQFTNADMGASLREWPAERWLKLSSPTVRRIMANRIQYSYQKGCDAIDPDNVGKLSYCLQMSFAALTIFEQTDTKNAAVVH